MRAHLALPLCSWHHQLPVPWQADAGLLPTADSTHVAHQHPAQCNMNFQQFSILVYRVLSRLQLRRRADMLHKQSSCVLSLAQRSEPDRAMFDSDFPVMRLAMPHWQQEPCK